MARAHVPDTGDVVWLAFSPQAGREQAVHRPALSAVFVAIMRALHVDFEAVATSV